jgi:hypothetical protein
MITSRCAEKVLNINFRENLNHALHAKNIFLNHAVYKIITINKAVSEGLRIIKRHTDVNLCDVELRQEYKHAVTIFSSITLHLINSV